jgi:hypothetical protein
MPGIRVALAQTRPWVLFLAVLGSLASAITGLAAIGTLVAGLLYDLWILILALCYGTICALSIALSTYLFVYARRIRDFLFGNRLRDLEAALFAQRGFWRLVGIVAALYVLLVVLFLIGTMLLDFSNW